MSEPSTVADSLEYVAPSLLHWTVEDDRIHNRSDAYALETAFGTILIDPLPLHEDLLEGFNTVQAICLTGRFHQRSAWRYQQHFDAPVYAPKNGEGYEGSPDHLYETGDTLPGGLKVVHAPGPTDAHYNFFLGRSEGNVMFIGDLLIRRTEGDIFKFVPAQYMDDPEITRESVRKLLNYSIEVLCPNHGAVCKGNVATAVKDALENDTELE